MKLYRNSLNIFLLIIIRIFSILPSMLAKTILVTGGNKGIGNAICKKILSDYTDTHVILGARDVMKGNEGIQHIVDTLGDNIKSRIELLLIDVSNEQSVQDAAASIKSKYGDSSLYAIVNNAGVVLSSLSDTLQTNYYGPIRVNNAFIPLLQQNIGRIVNIASASGPMYVDALSPEDKQIFLDPSIGTFEALEQRIQHLKNTEHAINGDSYKCYGLSKALLNIYTIRLAREYPNLKINSCTPGFILTDLTKGMGYNPTNLPEQGTISTLFLLFDEVQSGMYYGSDAVRSPLDKYRGPGDPAYNP